MGALIASPEAGDASVNIIPQMKKYSTTSADYSKSFVSTMSEKDSLNHCALTPATNSNTINILNKDVYTEMILMENNDLDEMSNTAIQDNCQFPYYRSNRTNGRYPDAVLVKDIGISCMLLGQNISELSNCKTNGYLVRQLKREYNDLSNITNKITAYTRDILNHLSRKRERKNQPLQNLVPSKHAIGYQYIDNEGNLCLKLRLFSNTGIQCNLHQIVKEFSGIHLEDTRLANKLCCKHSKHQITYKDHTVHEQCRKLKTEKGTQTVFSKENMEVTTLNLPSCSTSSIYNYLTMRKKKSCNEVSKPTFTKFNDVDKYRTYYKYRGDNRNYREQLKRCKPVMFTNWKEISRSKRTKNKTLSVISDESQETLQTNSREKILQKRHVTCNMINNLNTNFHTVNIRIVKPNKKPV